MPFGSVTRPVAETPGWAPVEVSLVPAAVARLCSSRAALIALAVLPAQHLLGATPGESLARAVAQEGAGLVGHGLATLLLEWLGFWSRSLWLVGLLF